MAVVNGIFEAMVAAGAVKSRQLTFQQCNTSRAEMVEYDALRDELVVVPAYPPETDRQPDSNRELRTQLAELRARCSRLCQMLEDANGGAPVWFEHAVKGDVINGHKWDGHNWQKLQLVEPSPETDRLWGAIRGASSR